MPFAVVAVVAAVIVVVLCALAVLVVRIVLIILVVAVVLSILSFLLLLFSSNGLRPNRLRHVIVFYRCFCCFCYCCFCVLLSFLRVVCSNGRAIAYASRLLLASRAVVGTII